MNTDIRLLTTFKGHRKRRLLRLLLGPDSTDYLLDLWLTVAQERPSGVLTGWNDRDVALAAGWVGDPDQFVKALKEAKLIEADGLGTMQLHDWAEHQPWVTNGPVRSATARLGGLAKAAKHGTMLNSTPSRKQQAISTAETLLNPAPSPSPSPKPKPAAVAASPYPQPPATPAAAATQDSSGNVATISKDKPVATIKDQLGEIVTIYEQNFGALTQLTGDWLKAWVAEYGETLTRDALTEAVKANVRKPKYVSAILKRWAAEGRGPPGNNGNGRHEKQPEGMDGWTGR